MSVLKCPVAGGFLQDPRSPLPDDGYPTPTSVEQTRQERQMARLFAEAAASPDGSRLLRDAHIAHCLKGLEHLSSTISYLDCSRTWLCYWMLHSLELLGWRLTDKERGPDFCHTHDIRSTHVVDWLSRCFTEQVDEGGSTYGGYGGGPGQVPHLAPTYAAVSALCILGTAEAYNSIPRDKILRWMLRLKTPECSLRMHEDGEVDIRAIYTCMAVASLLNIATPELTAGIPEYLLRCQTFEGGLGCEPYDEAHGGYTYCGLAALMILRSAHRLDVPSLLRWISARQKRLEGGFDGRTNKLVDSCYSFWVGATHPLVRALLCEASGPSGPRDTAILQYVHLVPPADSGEAGPSASSPPPADGPRSAASQPDEGEKPATCDGDWFFDERALQEYIIHCCQSPAGGLKDKPEKGTDYYHTCYALSGLAIAQNSHRLWVQRTTAATGPALPTAATVFGDPANLLECNSPVYNIAHSRVVAALQHFGGRTHL